MKRSVVFVLALAFCVMISAQTITNTNVKINGTNYSCKGTSYTAYDSTGLGNLSQLSLNGSIKNSGTSGLAMGYMFYRYDGGDWLFLGLDDKTTISENPPARAPEYSGEEGNSDDIITLNKTLTTYEIFVRSSNYSVDMSGLTNGATYNLDVFFRLGSVYDPADTTGGNYYTNTFTKIADIGFTDGTAFVPSITPGNSDELIGRFQLQADVTGANLTDASVDLSGTRSGFSNLKLWASNDASFDVGDTQLGSTIAEDPGSSAAVFSSFSMAIPTSSIFIFLTADVAEDATGSIQGVITEAADLTISDGEINTSISTAYMSNGSAEIPTSVRLSCFTAEAVQGTVELAWTTESETENSHFLIYRDGDIIAQVTGNGTTTEQHCYNYTDTQILAGNHAYVLSDVSFSGVETKQAPVNVEIESEDISADFVLEKAYPNPFNPSVTLSMEYGVGSNTVLNIYNSQGVLVDELIKGFVEAGHHNVTWDASNMPSGVYIVKMLAGNVTQSQKIVLMK